MKKTIRYFVISLAFLFVATSGYTQNFDMIVTTKGDSIVCRIDSITESHIYFEMKSQSYWRHTHIELTNISHYEKNAVKKGQYLYKPGTTIIKCIDEIRRNSIYAGIGTIYYSRTFRMPAGITLGVGLCYLDVVGVVLESTLLVGGPKHFFEPGINGFCLFDPDDGEIADVYGNDLVGGSVKMGYRYQGPKGFLFRIGTQLSFYGEEWNLLPSASIGYSF